MNNRNLKPMVKGRKSPKISHVSNAKLLKLLMEGTYTLFELAEETGLSYNTVRPYVNAMHKEGVVHVHMWEKTVNGREVMRIFKLGEGRDAKPNLRTQAEMNRDYRERRKQTKLLHAMAGSMGAMQ